MILRIAFAVLCLVTAPLAADERDTVHLKKGRSIQGRVVLELEDRIAVLVGSRERWVDRDKIARIDSIARSHREMLLRLRGVLNGPASRAFKLADFCRERGLIHEEKLLYWQTLLLDPDHAQAHERLGHRKKGDTWGVPDKTGLVPLNKIEQQRNEWNNAWQLRSEHFALRCDAGLQSTVHVLFWLEMYYDAFMGLFQRPLELREMIDPVQVYVYRNQDQFPAISNNVGAWFSGDERILYTYLQQDGYPYALFHEATHAVLHNLINGSRRGRGTLPTWLDEGWAEYMETVVQPSGSGNVRLDRNAVNQSHATTLAGTEKQYSLHRVLNFKNGDYSASTHQAEKYAQSYALFCHLLRGNEEAYRERFLEYIRQAIAGKGQASTFRRMFKREWDAIERDYTSLR